MRSCKTFLAVLLLAATAFAQSSASRVTLRGNVVDAQGLPIPQATVSAKNTDFGEPRVATSDASGNFLFQFLPPGTYMVTASAAAQATKKPLRVQLTVGSAQQITLKLEPKAVTSSTTVTARGGTVEGQTTAPAINKQDPKTSNTIAGLTVTYMPNRNRDFAQFQQLAAGAVEDQQGGTSILGQRNTYSAASLDGAELTDPLFGGQQGTTRDQFFLPQVVVREFQIVKSGATAEVGGTNAGFINIATKEGSNKFRGEAFYIGRPSAFTSHDAFGHGLDNVQNEFGGSIAGPIKKDKAFFLVGFEQDFLTIPAFTEFAPQPPGTFIPAAVLAQQVQSKQRSRPTALFVRTDFVLPKQNSLYFQANLNRIDREDVLGSSTRTLSSPEQARDERGQSSWVRGNLSSVVSNSMVNQFLAQWSRETIRSTPVSGTIEQVVNGFGSLGGASDADIGYGVTRVQLNEDLSLTRGTALFSMGVGYTGSPLDYSGVEFRNARNDFRSVASTVPRFRQSFIFDDPRLTGTLHRFGTYFNSRFELTPKITVNAGLRYEAQSNPDVSTTAIPDDANQWQPRLGIAWNPAATWVFRASAGLYDAPTPAVMFSRVFAENGANVLVADSYFDPTLPALSALSPGGQLAAYPGGIPSRVFAIDPDFQNPRSFQIAASAEKEINRYVSVSSGYVRNSTWALPRLVDRNLPAPVYDGTGTPIFGARPDPTVGQILTYESRAHSSFDGWLTTANFQLPKRSSLTANYTLSRTRDDRPLNSPLDTVTLLDPFNPALDAGYANLDTRHAFTLSGVVNLPFGFKVNPLIIARSGQPYTPIVGFDTQNDADDRNDRAIIGGHMVERNSSRQPAFFNFDLRFVKDFTLKGEGHHLDLFLDVLNVTGATNRNFGPEGVSVFGNAGAPVFSAGQPLFAPNTARIGGARQVQFTARIVAF